jgi:hypothetical protein
MPDYAILWEWLSFAVRWTHVITAIAWIGSSFYFIALDLGLRKTPSLPPLAHGEEWQVHGGGFYHIQKYLVAPDFLPEHLTWFKWESYFTWLSGFVLLVVVYYFGADLFLIDRHVLDVPTWGVDAGAAAAIRQALVDLAAAGSAIVMISQDLDELLELCDTLAVINGGRLSRAMKVSEADINEIGLLMGGIHGSSEPAAPSPVGGIGAEAVSAA